MAEKANMRVCFGPLKLRINSGLFHRLSSLKICASTYDYPPYYIPKPDPAYQDLHPPSEEDFDALNDFISTKSIKVMFFEPLIELNFLDHNLFEPSKGNSFKKAKKASVASKMALPLPKVTVEAKSFEISTQDPMYVNRLVHTTCQLPQPPEHMFDACYSKANVNIVGLSSHLLLKENNQTTIIVPFNVSYNKKSILKPQYWIKPDVIHEELSLDTGRFFDKNSVGLQFPFFNREYDV